MRYWDISDNRLTINIEKLHGNLFSLRSDYFKRKWDKAVVNTPKGRVEMSREYADNNILKTEKKKSYYGEANDYALYYYDFSKILRNNENKDQLKLNIAC